MILPINANWRIQSDPRSWAIETRQMRTRKGELVEEWRAVAWFSSLKNAVQGLAERMIRESEAQTVAEAAEDVKAVCAELCKALEPEFTVTVNKGAA